MEIKVVARIRVQVRRKLGVSPDCSRRLLKDALAFSVADDVVILSGDCLIIYVNCLPLASLNYHTHQSSTLEAACIELAISDGEKLANRKWLLVLLAIRRSRQVIERVLEVAICGPTYQ